MKNKNFFTFRLFLIILCICVFVGAMAFGFDRFSKISLKYSKENEESFIGRLKEMEIGALIDEANTIASTSQDMNSILYHVNILYERVGELSDNKIFSLIEDSTLDVNIRFSLIQMCKRLSLYPESFDKLLYDENIDDTIRYNLIWAKPVVDDDLSWLEEFAVGDNDVIAPHAFHRLEIESIDKALAVADQVLANEKLTSTERYKAAMYAKSIWFSENPPEDDDPYFLDFLDKCSSIVSATDDEMLIYSIGHMLRITPGKTALITILNNDKFDYLTKMGAVSEHYDILIDMTKSNPTKEELSIVQKAVEIHPVLEIVDALFIAYEKYPDNVPKGGIDALDSILKSGEGYYLDAAISATEH